MQTQVVLGAYLQSRFQELADTVNAILDENQTQSKLAEPSSKKSNEQIADEVIAGKWGNGSDRFNRLAQAGYDGNAVQNRVNEILGVNRIYKTVTAKSGLNIRENATTGSRRIAGVAYNEKVQVLEENVAKNNGHNWDKVKYDTVIGYVANTYLK